METSQNQLVNAYEKRYTSGAAAGEVVHTVNRDDTNQLTNIKISYHSGQPSIGRKQAKAVLNETGIEEDDDSVRSQGGGVPGDNPLHLPHTYDN